MKTKKTLLKNSLLFLLFLTILHSTSFSQTEDSLYYLNPEYHIAKELFNRRIVMLGDNGHHQPGVYHYLLNTLNNWLELSQTKDDTVNLTLIIENEEEMSNAVNEYIKVGNMQALVRKMKPKFYLEDLEYYRNLRKFSHRIDSLNLHRNKKISFKVKAFEQAGSINSGRVDSLLQRGQELWFVNERDSITAEGIINYMNSNPNEQILIFYGGAHLFNIKVDKIRMGGLQMLSPEEGQGFFLAHYLEKEFGAENVIKFATWGSILYKYAQKQDFPYPGRKNFIAKGVDLGVADTLTLGTDYIYLVQFDYLPLIEGNRICTKLILEKTIEAVNSLKSYRTGSIGQRFYYINLNNLYYLTGKYFRDDSLMNQMFGNDDLNITDWLYSNSFDSVLSPLNYMISQINGFFSNYGVDASKDSIMILLNRFKDLSAMFLIQRLKFTNSIGIYWFGYPEEKVKAKEYLVKFSGEDYNEPEKYLQWYRKKFYGYEY